jgi:hypothetical protein
VVSKEDTHLLSCYRCRLPKPEAEKDTGQKVDCMKLMYIVFQNSVSNSQQAPSFHQEDQPISVVYCDSVTKDVNKLFGENAELFWGWSRVKGLKENELTVAET